MTDRRPGPHRIDMHAHYLAPAYKEALQQAEMWLIGGIPVPEWTPELALEFMDAHGIAVQMLSVSDPGVEFVDHEPRAGARTRVQRLRSRGRTRTPPPVWRVRGPISERRRAGARRGRQGSR